MDSNEVDNSHSSSESDSSSHSSSENDSSFDLDDSPGELFLITKLNAYYSRLHKEPCTTSELSGRQFVIELLNGHPDRLFDFAIMNKNTFRNLCSTLKGLDFLQDDRSICVEGQSSLPIPDKKWQSLPPGHFKLNVDDALSLSSGLHGVDVTVRDSYGCLCGAVAMRAPSVLSVLATELYALKIGISFAVVASLTPLITESNSSTAIPLIVQENPLL
ncbi:PREDICTED: CICLE_v10013533mg [Prunus dulcis]|uniref:PREDICTED: CICLE_v10013533mg n=1 Tax=Prunus dulcis TaxID=3755 RepID=A0A5E4ERK7_PRUDU|nr:PREDICTED: CICLE_v10013533mg [Prunus dulcis]